MSRSLSILVFGISVIILGAAVLIYSATRPCYISGVVDHQHIGYTTDHGQSLSWYTVSIRLDNDDPLSNVNKGGTLAYIVSKADWEKVWPGDRVEALVTGDAQAEITKISREQSKLRVKVQYENGSDVPYALVAIINERWLTKKNESRAAVADSEGKIVFDSLMPDSYYVYAYKNGYGGIVPGLHGSVLSASNPELRWMFRE